MNKKQMAVLWGAIIIVTLLGVYPPMVYYEGGRRQRRDERQFVQVDAGRLLGYLVAVGAPAGGIIYVLRDRKHKKPKDEQK